MALTAIQVAIFYSPSTGENSKFPRTRNLLVSSFGKLIVSSLVYHPSQNKKSKPLNLMRVLWKELKIGPSEVCALPLELSGHY